LLKHSTVRFVLLIVAVACLAGLVFYVSAGASGPYLSSEDAIQERVEDGEVVLDYETEHLRVFAVSRQQGEVELYAVKRRMGFWVWDYPSERNIQEISYVGNDAYIYLVEKTGSTGIALCLESEDGGRIDPLKSAQVLAQGTDTGGYAVAVFKIADYGSRPGNYRLVISDLSGEPLNAKADELDFDSIALFCGTGDDSRLLEYSPEELSLLADQRTRLLDAFRGVISRKTPIEPVCLEGAKRPEMDEDIHASTILGTYYKVEGKYRIFRWTHQVSYHLVLNGEYEGVLLRHETSYTEHSLFEDGLSAINTSYKAEPGPELDALVHIYHLFFPRCQL
jgi:hypothetical protein